MEKTAPQVRIGDWISEGWKMFADQWKSWVTIALGFFAVVVVPIGVFIVGFYAMIFATVMAHPQGRGAPQPEVPVGLILGFYIAMFGLVIVLVPLSVFIAGGAYRAAFKQMRGGHIEFRDLFSARDCYWRLLGATLMSSILICIGGIFCIIPAFIVAGLLFFTVPLIVERNLGVLEAMRASRDLTKQNLLMFTIFAFLVQLLASIGSQLCYVGLLVTWPLMFTTSAVAFRDCFGVEGARSFSQQPLSSTQTGQESAQASYARPFEGQPITCPKCQASLPPAARFCYHCGWDVSS